MWSPTPSAPHDLTQLPVEVTLQDGESGLGYLLRALRVNGITFDRGVQWLGLRRDKPLQPRLVRQIAWKLNTSYELLAGRLVMEDTRGGMGWVRLGGQRFSKDVATVKQYAKLCPLCVRSKGIARMSWLLRASVGCAEHGYSLITACSRCGINVGWDRPDVDICCCGRPFANQGSIAPLEPRVLAWQVWMESTLLSGTQFFPRGLADCELPVPLLQLSIDGAFRIVEALGLCKGSPGSVRAAKAECKSFQQLGAVLDRGIARLHDVAVDMDTVATVRSVANTPALKRIAQDPGAREDQALASWLLQCMQGEPAAEALRTGIRPKGQLPLFLVR